MIADPDPSANISSLLAQKKVRVKTHVSCIAMQCQAMWCAFDNAMYKQCNVMQNNVMWCNAMDECMHVSYMITYVCTYIRMCVCLYVQFTYGPYGCASVHSLKKSRFQEKYISLYRKWRIHLFYIAIVDNCGDINFHPQTVDFDSCCCWVCEHCVYSDTSKNKPMYEFCHLYRITSTVFFWHDLLEQDFSLTA